ncbi:MalY/PatB family protein [Ligilactobacillus cholophilus]|uniref:MalY/PatB family protein n=1 Tax=Ligilactobacillus cholophilus TaxID=3050131 RepID=UPI0025AF7D41|nr:PatB family C-S lyase [Ligilactobacillus cholophilus]
MNKDDFIKEYAINRENTDSVKWDGLKDRFGQTDLLPMWIADTEFKIPKQAQQAMQKRIEEGAFGYSFVDDGYYDAYFNWQKERYGIELHKEWVRFGTGVVQSLSTILQLLTQKDEAVMVLQPVYYPFMDVVKQNKRNLIVSNLINNHGHYELDLDDMRQKMEENQVHVLIFCNPHNPVGRVWNETELTELLELCRQEQVILISDEIHHDLTIDGNKFVSTLNVRDGFYRDNLVVLDSPSKTFNMAGLLNSHVIIPNPQLMKRYDEYAAVTKAPTGSVMGRVAAQAAYTYGVDWLEGLQAVIASNYRYMRNEFKQELPEVVISPLEGTYLAWIDLSALIPEEDLEEVVQEKAKLAVDYGKWFGDAGKGHIRMNLATTPGNVEQAVQSLIQAIKDYQE